MLMTKKPESRCLSNWLELCKYVNNLIWESGPDFVAYWPSIVIVGENEMG